MTKFIKSCWHSSSAWLAIITIWAVGYVVVGNDLLIPSPVKTFAELWQLLGTDKFQGHVLGSLESMLIGWTSAMILLLSVGLVMLISERFKNVSIDLSSGWQAAPTFSLAPIVIMAFGYSRLSAMILITWGVIWYGINHLAAEITEAQHRWGPHADNLQWGFMQQFFRIYLPALLPGLLLVAKNGWSMMWRTLIAMEILFGSMSGGYGLGSLMVETKTEFRVLEMWSILIVILVLGISINKMFDVIRKRVDW